MSDKLVTLKKRIHQNQNGTLVLIAHEGDQVKESLITSLGYSIEDVTTVAKKVRTEDVEDKVRAEDIENKAVKPAKKSAAKIEE